MFYASGITLRLQTGFKLYLSRISDKKRRAVPMRTRENTRKCTQLRDKQKWMKTKDRAQLFHAVQRGAI
jgi:hypothetical protein